MRVVTSVLVGLILAAHAVPVRAQDPEPATRAAAQRREREAKEQTAKPNEPDPLAKAMSYIEGRGLYLLSRNGFYPKIGSLTTGSGLAYGVGFRDRAIFNRRGALEVWAAASAKRYWATEARATFPEFANRRLTSDLFASLREYPRESFFGIGPESRRRDEAGFLLRTAEVAGRLGVHVAPALTVGAGLGYLAPQTGRSNDDDVPSVTELFSPAQAPGAGIAPEYIKASTFVEVDYREPRNARRGGYYRFDLTRYDDRETAQWNFTRADLDLQQFIGFFADRRVLALRAFLSSSEAADGAVMPFYLMPSLGGNDTLRGFRNYRFRGPHAMLLQAEYRWEIWSGLDAAFFYDAGKVGLRRADLGLRSLESDYGFGFRFNTAAGVVMRVDAAFGSRDGRHLHIVFGGVF